MLIKNISYIDIENIFNTIKNIPEEQKLVEFLKISDVKFYDEKFSFVKESSVGICGIGGIPINIINNIPYLGGSNCNIDIFFDETKKMKAIGAFMSYLNIGNKTINEMNFLLDNLGHKSTEHMIYLNILVSGVSTSVENEFNSQRDIVHLARITEARTKIQNNPPYVILDESLIETYKIVKGFINISLKEIKYNNKNQDFYEARNLIHPSCKATAFILSGTIRNIKKLVLLKNDIGKELEFRKVLSLIDNFCLKIYKNI